MTLNGLIFLCKCLKFLILFKLEKLPYPKLGVSQVSQGTISVDWRLSKPPPDNIKLTHFVLTLVGCEFGNSIKSDARYYKE